MNKAGHIATIAGAVVVAAGATFALTKNDVTKEPTTSPTPTVSATPTPSLLTVSLQAVTQDIMSRSNGITGTVTNGSGTVQDAIVTVSFVKGGNITQVASTLVTGVPAKASKTFSFQTSDLYTDYDSTTATVVAK
jgi:hypothetical protein